jgi:hypothetical protein
MGDIRWSRSRWSGLHAASQSDTERELRRQAQRIAARYRKPLDVAMQIARQMHITAVSAQVPGKPTPSPATPKQVAAPRMLPKFGRKSVRKENTRRSRAAGVGAGEWSEVDRPPKRRTPRPKRRYRKDKEADRRKSNADVRAERDALVPFRRIPGSFENGKRR